MANKRPNTSTVNKVRTKLKSEGKLDVSTMTGIKIALEKKRAKMERNKLITTLFRSEKKRELDETISALTYRLENEIAQD